MRGHAISIFLILLFFVSTDLRAEQWHYDGMYSIEFACDLSTPQCDLAPVSPIDGFSLIDTQDRTKTAITFVSRSFGFVAFALINATFNEAGDELSAASSYNEDTPRATTIRFLNRSGEISGTFEDTHSFSRYIFHGAPLHWVGEWTYRTAAESLVEDQLLGGYRSEIAGYTGTLIVKKFSGKLVASFLSDARLENTSIIQLNFSHGTWDPHCGVLRLTTANPRTDDYGELAFILQPRNALGQLVLSGFEVMGFKVNPMTITKTIELNATGHSMFL